MKQQQYIAPRMERVNFLSEGLLAGSNSIGISSDVKIHKQADILNQGKSTTPSIWE